MWYVVQVQSGKERQTLDLMQRFVDGNTLQEVFLPQREEMRSRKGSWYKTTDLLFRGYVFAITKDPDLLYSELMKVPAFTRMLGQNDQKFIPLSQDEISFISHYGGDERLVRVSEGIMEGDQVKVLDGPLFGQEGIIEKIDMHKKAAWVNVFILGREIKIKFGLDIVRKN